MAGCRPAAVATRVAADTALVSIMHANNEVGTLQPVAEIAALTRPRGILLHTDAAQSAGKIAARRRCARRGSADAWPGTSSMRTKGVGALYVRAGTPIGADRCSAPIRSTACGRAPRMCRRSSGSAPRPGSRGNACRKPRPICAACAIACIAAAGRSPALCSTAIRTSVCPTRCTFRSPVSAGRELLHDASDGRGRLGRLGLPLRARRRQRRARRDGLRCGRAAGAVRLSVGWMTTEDDLARAAAG